MSNTFRAMYVVLASAFLAVLFYYGNTGSVHAEGVQGPGPDEAVYLIDDMWGYVNPVGGGGRSFPSGWDIDRRGGDIVGGYMSAATIKDTSKRYPFVMTKKFDRIDSGKSTLEVPLQLSKASNGVALILSDDDQEVIRFETQNGSICYRLPGSACVSVAPYSPNVMLGLKLQFDLDENRVKLAINGSEKAEFALGSTSTNVAFNQIAIRTPVTDKLEIVVRYIKLYVNYLVNESFSAVGLGLAPDDWQHNGGAAVQSINGIRSNENYSLKLQRTSGTADSVVSSTYFERTAGKVRAEFMTLMPERMDGVAFELGEDGAAAIELYTDNGAFYYGNTLVYPYTNNIWYTIAFEADSIAQTVDIWINGKRRASGLPYQSAIGELNHFKASVSNAAVGTVWLDDVKLQRVAPEPIDYVPQPRISAKQSELYVGMNVCSLWREGYHLGWDMINAYSSERKPYLGFYDEGSPEAADWEIKWMVENGVDYQSFLWYLPTGWKEGAIKEPRMSEALHDGYFNAKYSDYMKFALYWENSNTTITSEEFRNIIIPYWVEYYFKDPRYMAVDNKPVIKIFQYTSLINSFGSAANAKVELDYLRDVIKGLGFDDAILMTVFAGTNTSYHQTIADMGFDAIDVYIWGTEAGAADYTYQYNKLKAQNSLGITEQVPTASMGWDDEAWRGASGLSGYIEPSELETLLLAYRDEFLPLQDQALSTSKMITLGTWNEFGEGHFFMPSGIHGFDYMDAIRRVFTETTVLQQEMPTEAAKQRMSRLYSEDRYVFKEFKQKKEYSEEDIVTAGTILKEWTFNDTGSLADWTVTDSQQVDDLRVENGILKGTATGNDAGIVLANDKKISVSAEAANFLVVRMKLESLDYTTNVYFRTNTDSTWNQTKSIAFTATSQDMKTYIVDLSDHAYWEDTITDIRFDPMRLTGDFEVDSIQLVHYEDAESVHVSLDGTNVDLNRSLVSVSHVVYMPLDELLERTNAYTTFDLPAETAHIERDDITVSITTYGDTMKVNGSTMAMPHPMFKFDDTYYVPLQWVYEQLGFDVTYDTMSRTFELTTPFVPAELLVLIPSQGDYYGSTAVTVAVYQPGDQLLVKVYDPGAAAPTVGSKGMEPPGDAVLYTAGDSINGVSAGSTVAMYEVDESGLIVAYGTIVLTADKIKQDGYAIEQELFLDPGFDKNNAVSWAYSYDNAAGEKTNDQVRSGTDALKLTLNATTSRKGLSVYNVSLPTPSPSMDTVSREGKTVLIDARVKSGANVNSAVFQLRIMHRQAGQGWIQQAEYNVTAPVSVSSGGWAQVGGIIDFSDLNSLYTLPAGFDPSTFISGTSTQAGYRVLLSLKLGTSNSSQSAIGYIDDFHMYSVTEVSP